MTTFNAFDIVNGIVVDYHGGNEALVITMVAIAVAMLAMLMTALVVMALIKSMVKMMNWSQ